MSEIDPLKYPVGLFLKPEAITAEHLTAWIATIAEFPQKIAALTETLTEETLTKTYRPDGWTIRQLVHHCADSHMNAFIRFKLALTEEAPKIKPYFEDQWAELPDTRSAAISSSLKLIEGLHARWTTLLQSLHSEDLNREYIHPEHGKRFSLAETIGMYAWHCEHHLAHIAIALKN